MVCLSGRTGLRTAAVDRPQPRLERVPRRVLRRSVRSGPPGRHDRRRSERHRPGAQRPHRLLAQPRLRPLRPADHHGQRAVARRRLSTPDGCFSPTSTARAAPTWCTSMSTACTSGSTSPATHGASARPSPARRAPTTRPPWSSPTCSAPARPPWSGATTSPGRGTSNYKALDFCGGGQAVRARRMDNNMGATTRVSYAPSTRYFLEDQADGNPWVTTLPFPVQVVDKVEVIDHVSRTKLVTTYRYHHGYYDGREREFRGFGRVDQFDTETFEDFSRPIPPATPRPFSNGDRGLPCAAGGDPLVVPHRHLLRRVCVGAERAPRPRLPRPDQRFRQEYYSGDGQAVPLDEHDVETGETPARGVPGLARRPAAHRAVRPRRQRQRADHPYQVTENRYRVAQLQPRTATTTRCYFSHQLESLTYHYERNPADPRISHGADAGGRCLRQPAQDPGVAYGRRQPDQRCRPRQTATSRHARSSLTPRTDSPTPSTTPRVRMHYRAPAPSETRHLRADRLRTACARCPTLQLRRMGGQRLRRDSTARRPSATRRQPIRPSRRNA